MTVPEGATSCPPGCRIGVVRDAEGRDIGRFYVTEMPDELAARWRESTSSWFLAGDRMPDRGKV